MKKSQPNKLRVMRETIRELTQNAEAAVGGRMGNFTCGATGCAACTVSNATSADNNPMTR